MGCEFDASFQLDAVLRSQLLIPVTQTKPFNDPEMWPEDGSQPFVWSTNDK